MLVRQRAEVGDLDSADFFVPHEGTLYVSMNAEFLAILEYWEREKGINKDVLVKAVEDALLSAAKKAVGPARELRCAIDPKTGDIRAFAKLVVSERVISKHDQISLFDARRIKPDAQFGEEVEVEVTPANFGRIASQNAKQALMQHIRRAEKELIYSEFKDRTGDIVSGVVRRFERSDVTVDLGKFEALLPNRERVPTEEYQIGERIRCYVKAVEQTPHGPEIILSRAQRVKNIVRELNNEKVDIIKWDPNVRNFITNALAPAKLKTFEIDEARRRVKVLVSEDQLSLAIGKRGQNARLTSKLTGWQVDIEPEHVATMGFAEKVAQAVRAVASIPGITPEQADALVHGGLLSLEDLLQAEASYLAEIPAIGDQAPAIIEAVKAEVARRNGPAGEAGETSAA